MTLIEYLAITKISKSICLLWFTEDGILESYIYGPEEPIEDWLLNMQVEEVEQDIDVLNIWLI